MNPAYLSIIRRTFIWDSVVRYTGLVHSPEFEGFPLFGRRKCIVSMGIAVGTSTVVRYWEGTQHLSIVQNLSVVHYSGAKKVVRYTEEVRYWEGLLSEVPLCFVNFCFFHAREVFVFPT